MATLITSNIPEEMKKLPQWVMWKLELRKNNAGEEKQTKVPYQINGKKAAADKPETWSTFENVKQAIMSKQEQFTGIGFVFTEESGIMGVDFDHVKEKGVWDNEALEEIRSFNSYWEMSQSGTGAHVYIKAKMSEEQLSGNATGRKAGKGQPQREVYFKKRFFVVTGNMEEGESKINVAQDVFDNLFEKWFSKPETIETSNKKSSEKTEKILSPDMTDEEVLNCCNNAKNSEKFKKLFAGKFEEYQSQSDAVQALCNIVAWYSQKPEQIDRIFRKSGLMYEKWERIGNRTTVKAIDIHKEYFKGKQTIEKTAETDKTHAEIMEDLGKLDTTNFSTLDAVKKYIVKNCMNSREDKVEAIILSEIKEKFGLKTRDIDNILKFYKNEKKNQLRDKQILNKVIKDVEGRFGNFITSENGIIKIKRVINQKTGEVTEEEEVISKVNCDVEAIGENIDSGSILYKLSFRDNLGREKKIWKANHELLQKAGVLSLLKDGMFFTEKNASNMTEFFEVVINTEKENLVREIAASRNGWKLNNTLFVCGNTGYSEEGERDILQMENPLTDLYTKKGSLDNWVSGTKELWKYQVMHMKMYLTCAPVILTLLGIPSFVVEQRLHSGRMKTETSRVAASAFGNPVDLQLTADSTKCGVLAHVEFNNNLATFIDEAKISTEIRDLVYMIANETGRSKSNKEHGLERAKNSTTVAILTCENPILPDNAHTGELVRVMPLPWGVETVLPQETVMQITDTYLENYGHFGPLFLKKVFEQQKDLKKKFNEILAEFPSNENDQNDVVTSERAKRFYAATALTGCLVEEILTEIGSKAEIESEAGLGEDQTEIGSKVEIESEVGLKTMSAIELCKALYTQNVIRAARFEPTYLKAFRSAASIFARNSVYFEEDEEEKDNKLSDLDEETIFTEKKDINHERYGWVRKCTLKDPEGNKIATEECVCFDPKVLKKLLKEEEYAFEGVLKDWRDKDLIYYSWEGKGENRYKNTTQVIRIVKGGIQTSTRAIVIPFSKILDKTGGNDEYPELALNDQHAGKKALKGAKDVLETLNLPVTERNLEIAHENRERILAICRKQQGDPTKKQNGEPVTTEELIQDYIEKESEKIKKMAETIFQKFVERGAVVAQV